MTFPLNWISEQAFNSCMERLVEKVKSAKEEAPERSKKNILDPFSSLLTAFTFGAKSRGKIEEIQSTQLVTSNISSALGNFHQEILGSVEGWKNHDAGYDLECSSRSILAEIKNKHNTMNASNREKVISELDTAVRQKGKGWEAYLVIVIPKKSNTPRKKLTSRNVYEVGGAFFYELVTGDKNALYNTFDCALASLKTRVDIGYEISEYCQEIRDLIIPYDRHSDI